jgi:hypothetical protein
MTRLPGGEWLCNIHVATTAATFGPTLQDYKEKIKKMKNRVCFAKNPKYTGKNIK